MSQIRSPQDFAAAFCVSRETMARLAVYADLLERWNARLNLVGRSAVTDLWHRHMADSAQLLPLAPPEAVDWVDLGSGAGFPGLPVAALAKERGRALRLTLIESDQRKVAFLSEAARLMELAIEILRCRIETLAPRRVDVVSARALAPLDRLCELAYPLTAPVAPGENRQRPVFLFPKGKEVDLELTAASVDWHIRGERIASRTNPEATVLRIVELEPRK